MTDEGLVYFVFANAGTGRTRIKIGWSKTDPLKRMKDLQIGSPIELELLGCVPGTRRREAELHREFALYRAHGEWFMPCPEILELLSVEGSMLHPMVKRMSTYKQRETSNRCYRRHDLFRQEVPHALRPVAYSPFAAVAPSNLGSGRAANPRGDGGRLKGGAEGIRHQHRREPSSARSCSRREVPR